MAVVINEFLPNPKGADSGAEWVELKNTSSEAINLAGWSLENGSGKKFQIPDSAIGPGVYALIHTTKSFSLKNSDGRVVLKDSSGNKIDQAGFFGSAPEGLSWSRWGSDFSFSQPTPGAQNLPGALMPPPPAYGQMAGKKYGYWEIIPVALCWGLVMAVLAAIITHWINESHKLVIR